MQLATNNLNEGIQRGETGKGLSVGLWIAQVLMAALFLFSGVMKFIMPMAEMTRNTSLPGWFFYFIGAAEILGAVGLIVPALTRIRPALTPIAAIGLVIIMIGATALSLPMGAFALFPLFVCLMTAFIAYGRLRLRPIQSRG